MTRARFYLLLLVVSIGLGALLWTLSSDVRGTTFRLNNGDQLTFLGSSVGTNGSYCYGNPFQRIAAKLPGGLGNAWSGGTLANSEDRRVTNIVFWFHYRGKEEPFFRLGFQAVDDQAVVTNPGFTGGSHPLGRGEMGVYFDEGILPRRSKTILLRIYDRKDWTDFRLVGELRIPNPRAGQYPVWKPEPLPAMRQFGEFAVSLEEMSVTMNSSWQDVEHLRWPANVARARIRIVENGRATDDWAFFGAQCEDATGDFSPSWYLVWNRIAPGHLEITGKWPLWPGERTVKLQTLWVRKEIQPPERVVIFYGVPLPPASVWTSVIANTNHPLGKVQVSCGSSQYSPTGVGVLELFSDDSRFYRYDEPEVQCYYFQDARDDKGRPLERLDARRFKVLADAKTVDMAIHLPRAKRAAFVVQPNMITTNQSDWSESGLLGALTTVQANGESRPASRLVRGRVR